MMNIRHVATLSFILSGFWGIHAQALDARVSQAKFINLELQGTNSTEETKTLRVKDTNSGKIAQVKLQRQAGDKGNYKGFFIIQFFAGDTTPRVLEFYEPGKQAFFVYATEQDSSQQIMLFAKAEQMDDYVTKQVKSIAPVAPTGPLSPKKLEAVVREKNRVQEKMQMSLEEEMVKKRLALMEEAQKMSQAEKKKKAERAAAFVKQADAAYAAQNYPEAEGLYAKAVEANPEEDSYYYRYGVTLYKVDKYNQSLAALSVAEDPDKTLEKQYYVALNHLKLQDFVKARKEMVEIRDENDPDLSPYAAFFAGTMDMQKKNFSEARKNMQYVLDNSKDTSLDRSADELMEQIDQLERYYDSKKEKFRFSFFGGLVYDTNILNVAANNLATDVKGYRLNYGATALGIWYRTMESDLGTQLSVSDYYSVNSQLQGDATLQTTDPLVFAMSVPYHRDWVVSKKSLRWELQPSYSSTYMAPTGGNRKEIIRSTGANTTLSYTLQSDLLMAGRMDFSSDKSYLDITTSDDDQSGTKMGFTLTPTKLLDLKGEKSISAELGYLLSNTNGKNNKSSRLGFALTYAFPMMWKSNGSARVDYSTTKYADASVPRTDKVASLTLASVKDLTKSLSLLLSFQYSTSNSEVDSYKYDKYIVTSLLTYTTSILGK